MIQVAQAPSDIQDKVTSVSDRYEKLVDRSQKAIASLEEFLDIFQQFQDLQRAYQDYQKQQWEQLTSYSDYTANKTTLQNRLAKVLEIQDKQNEGELKLNVLAEHVSQSASSLSPKVYYECMKRDVANLR